MAEAGGAMLWEAQRVNAFGGLEQQRFGNNVQTRVEYQPATGRIAGIDAGIGTATNVLSHDYGWDRVGNLTSRTDNNGPANGTGAVTETYQYDAINRLYEYTVMHPAISGGARTVRVDYNAGGNVLAKTDVGTYRYAANGGIGPHRVQEVRPLGGGSITYGYDANGNVTSTASTGTNNDNRSKYTTLGYTSFNLPDSSQGVVGANGTRYTWQYDERHARVRETKVSAAGTRTTWSLHPDKSGGLAFEQEFAENGTVTNRNFLTAGGAVIGVLITQGDTWVNNAQVNRTTVVRTEYLHKDHLGSTAAVTDGAGAVTARYAFDPWGKRRFTNGTYDAFGTLVIEFSAGNTDRGFTGHEHLDDVGIVHMNGRLYDAHTGRFLQPDPYVQEVLLLQNFNRYSYVLNNPLNATDPSGEFIPLLLFVAAAFIVAKHVPELRPFMAIAVSIVIGPVGPWSVFGNNIASAAFAGFSAGAVGSGSFKGGIQGMFSGAVFYGIGDSFGRVSWANPGEMAKAVAAHAAAGCAMQAVSGGNCRAGALSGAFSKATAPLIQKDIVVGTVVSAIVGGTGSELGKGKFANGAVTGSFSYLFNEITTAVEHFKGLSDDPELGSPRWSMGRLNGTTPLPETEISGLRFAAATSEALLLWNPSRWLATGAQILGWGAAVEQAFDPQDPSFGGIAGALASYATELSSSSIRSSVVVGYAAEKSWEFLAPRWAEDMRQSRVTPAQVSLSCARPHAYRQ